MLTFDYCCMSPPNVFLEIESAMTYYCCVLFDTESSMKQKGIMGNVGLLVITDMTIRSTACRFVV